MREILFRAKNKVTLEWEYGSLLQSEIDTNGKCRCAIAERFADDFCVNMVPVIPETVGQFTGLLDKHEKKIFEGDTVKQKLFDAKLNEHICKVKYSNTIARFVLVNENDDEMGFGFSFPCEVIGTIHD